MYKEILYMDYSGSPELLNASIFVVSSHNKHIFDEIELDIMNYQYQSMSYLPVLKAETDDTDTKVDNSWYRYIKTKLFIVHFFKQSAKRDNFLWVCQSFKMLPAQQAWKKGRLVELDMIIQYLL